MPCEFEYLELGDDGTAVVIDSELRSDGGYESAYSYIGMDGQLLFDATFESAQPFRGDYAVVCRRIPAVNTNDSEPYTVLLGTIDRAL